MALMLHAKVEIARFTLCGHGPASRRFKRDPSRFDDGWTSFVVIFHRRTSPPLDLRHSSTRRPHRNLGWHDVPSSSTFAASICEVFHTTDKLRRSQRGLQGEASIPEHDTDGRLLSRTGSFVRPFISNFRMAG